MSDAQLGLSIDGTESPQAMRLNCIELRSAGFDCRRIATETPTDIRENRAPQSSLRVSDWFGSPSNGSTASQGRKGPVTQDYLDAIADTRTTVSEQVYQEFLEDIDVLGRV